MNPSSINRNALHVAQKRLSIIANNLAHAQDKNYTRQELIATSAGTHTSFPFNFGTGVRIETIRDTRIPGLDKEFRSAQSLDAGEETRSKWLSKIESIYTQSEANGIDDALNKFWDSWNTLSHNPSSLAERSSVIYRAEEIADTLRELASQHEALQEEVGTHLSIQVSAINSQIKNIFELNQEIVATEMGAKNQALDLRNMRNTAIDELSKHLPITCKEVDGHVIIKTNENDLIGIDRFDTLEFVKNMQNGQQPTVALTTGGPFRAGKSGELSALLSIRDKTIPQKMAQLDSLARSLMDSVNHIYSNGAQKNGYTKLTSALGYEAFGGKSVNDTLGLLTYGETQRITIGFYNGDELVRTSSIILDSADTMYTVGEKLNAIPGLNASLLPEGQLDLNLNSTLETGFSIINNERNSANTDASKALEFFGFTPGAKSTNNNSTNAAIQGVDIKTLYNKIQEQTGQVPTSTAEAKSIALGIYGSFTIDTFETANETNNLYNGHHLQQIIIPVDPQDSLDTIQTKINQRASEAGWGTTLNYDNSTDSYVLSSTDGTDSSGNFTVPAAVTRKVRLGFGNQYAENGVDEKPKNYSSLGDASGLFGKLQLNALFKGRQANDIRIDNQVTVANLHTGFSLAPGDGKMALAMHNLRDAKLVEQGNVSLNKAYANIVTNIASEAKSSKEYSNNFSARLQSIDSERQSAHGVNTDKEMHDLMTCTTYYQFNAIMMSKLHELEEMIISLVR